MRGIDERRVRVGRAWWGGREASKSPYLEANLHRAGALLRVDGVELHDIHAGEDVRGLFMCNRIGKGSGGRSTSVGVLARWGAGVEWGAGGFRGALEPELWGSWMIALVALSSGTMNTSSAPNPSSLECPGCRKCSENS